MDILLGFHIPKRGYMVKDKMDFKLLQNELKYQLEHGTFLSFE